MSFMVLPPPPPDESAETPAGTAAGDPALRWDDRLRLGVEEIDRDHETLVDYCNELVAAVSEGHGAEAVARTVRRMREYTMSHFVAEERFMQNVGYPDLERHRKIHESLVLQVKKLQRRIYEQEPPTSAEMRVILKEWLVDHILGEDLKIAAFLKTRAVARQEATEPPSEPSED